MGFLKIIKQYASNFEIKKDDSDGYYFVRMYEVDSVIVQSIHYHVGRIYKHSQHHIRKLTDAQ